MARKRVKDLEAKLAMVELELVKRNLTLAATEAARDEARAEARRWEDEHAVGCHGRAEALAKALEDLMQPGEDHDYHAARVALAAWKK